MNRSSNDHWLRGASYAGAAFGYSVLLVAMGIPLAGAGHGVGLFWMIGLVCMASCPISGSGIALAERAEGTILFLISMTVQYMITVSLVLGAGSEWHYLEKMWPNAGGLVLLYVGTYLAGQAVLWGAFVKRAWRSRPRGGA